MWWVLACSAPAPDPARPKERPTPLEGAAPYTLEISVRPDPLGGVLRVTETFRGLRASALTLHRPDEVIPIEEPRADGVALIPDGPGRWRVDDPLPDPLVVSYVARPGALGRHGHQGWVGRDFATFDGRILLRPRAESPLGGVTFRFTLPDGWTVAGPLEPAGDAWTLSPPLPSLLEHVCVGLGPFRRDDFPAGATTVSTFVHEAVPTEVAARLLAETHALADAFHAVGFDPGTPLAFVRYPAVSDHPLFGGASAFGACFEDEKPGEPGMNVRLLGHRFAHPQDRYAPTGWQIRDARDLWFEEGHAGWAEVEMGIDAGLYGDDPIFWFDRMYEGYRDVTRTRPERLVPIARDGGAEDGDHTEFLHYQLAPLVVRLLDHLLQERGGTDLRAVSRALSERYGGHRGTIPLRAEIDRLGNADYADFWAGAVDRPADLAPTWPGWVTDAVRRDHAADPTDERRAAFLADRSARYADVAASLREEATRRAELAALGVTLAHADVLANVRGLPDDVREHLVAAEAAWPRHGARAPAEVPLPPVLGELLAREQAYEAALGGASGLRAIRVVAREKGQEGHDTLVVPRGRRIEVRAAYDEVPGLAVVELVQGDRVERRALVAQPGKREVGYGFHAKDRPDEPGLLTVRVVTPAGSVERVFWVR